MSFADRAVRSCAKAMSQGRVSERHVRDVIRCEEADVAEIEEFLSSSDATMRQMAARVVGGKGRVEPVIEAALCETDRMVLVVMLRSLKGREGLERLAVFLSDDDGVVQEEAISMFKESGNYDCLLLLMFDKETALVERAKRYINERKRDK